jgi:alpha-D-ribose 1-methylphosphonate 5-triphosphate synthase subunit PhnI
MPGGRTNRPTSPASPRNIPIDRDTRLQALARGDEGFLLALAYSTQRGYAPHATPSSARSASGEVDARARRARTRLRRSRWRQRPRHRVPDGERSSREVVGGEPPQFTRGYGLVFGQSRAQGDGHVSLVRPVAQRADELGEETSPHAAQDEEFVSSNIPTMCRRPASSSI